MNGIEFLNWLIPMVFAFGLGRFVATRAFGSRTRRNISCGPLVVARPPGDLDSMSKLAKEKDEELEDKT